MALASAPVQADLCVCPIHQGQLVGVALSFLRNFGLLSGASGALGALSAGVGALAGDQAVQKERQEARAERQIGGVRQGLMEGGSALGQGVWQGVTGLVSKPVQGAQSAGALGECCLATGEGIICSWHDEDIWTMLDTIAS